jgi:hypothetical protein
MFADFCRKINDGTKGKNKYKIKGMIESKNIVSEYLNVYYGFLQTRQQCRQRLRMKFP